MALRVAYFAGMRKSTHSNEYQQVKKVLLELRKEAGLTHRELATKLVREYSLIWRIEKAERRLDVVEFYWYCKALNADPRKSYGRLVTAMESGVAEERPARAADPKGQYKIKRRSRS